MDQQDQRLVNQSILQRLQMQEMQKRILQSVAGNMGAGRFANPNMTPNQPPPGPITGGASTFPKTVPPPVPPFNTQTTPFISPQPQQNPPLGGSIPPGGIIPQLPGAMPLNQSIIPKTTPGQGGPPVIDPNVEAIMKLISQKQQYA